MIEDGRWLLISRCSHTWRSYRSFRKPWNSLITFDMPPLRIPSQKSRPQCSKDYGTLLRPPFSSTTLVYDTVYRHIWHSRMHLQLRTSESSNPQSKTFPMLPEPTIVSSSKLLRTSSHHILASSQSSTICALILVLDSLDHSRSSPNALDVARHAGTK
jgi:hypothetical protein